MRAIRRLFALLAIAGLTGAGVYAASPFYAAWTVHEAIRTGDVRTLDRKVAWEPVRRSLKASLRSEMLGAMTSEAEARGLDRPSLWQRIKTSVGTGMAERFVDATFNPRGLVTAYAAVKPKDDDGSFGALMRLAGRVTRVEPLSLTRIRIAMSGVQTPGRLYVGDLELQGSEWRLVALSLETAPHAAPAAASATVLKATVK